MLNVHVWVNLILPSTVLSVCILVYQEYTNANIGPWQVET